MIIRPLLIALALSPFALASEPWARHTIDNQSRGADGARLSDVNKDGLPDLVTPWEEGGIIRVCLHPGAQLAEQPWPGVTVGKVASPEDAVFVDLDADGAIDVVSSCEGETKTMFVHWAPRHPQDYLKAEKWRTQPFPATKGKQAWMFALPKDMDGKYGIDLVVSSKGVDAGVGWLEAPEDARDLEQWNYHRLAAAGWIMSLIEADVNGDSFADILFSDRRGAGRGIKWLQHPGNSLREAGSPWPLHTTGGQDHEVMFIDYADLNEDGRKDILAATHQGEILILEQIPDRSWQQAAIPAPFQSRHGKSVRVGDIDLDGVMDLVHGTEPNPLPREPGITWLKRASKDDSQPVAHPISNREGSKFDLLQLVDVDRDGDLDVITCEERDHLGLIWYENPAR